jgi:hypothetical protein
VRRLRADNARLEAELEGAREGAARHSALERELAQLRWQIAKMEDSRNVCSFTLHTYELITYFLASFLWKRFLASYVGKVLFPFFS